MTSPDTVGSDIIDRIVAATRGVPGVGDAVAVVRTGVRRTETRKPTATPVPDDPAAAPADLYGGPIPIPAGAPRTLQEALTAAAEQAPDKGTVFIRQGEPDDFLSYADMLHAAERVLAGLRAHGLRPGDAALFTFDDNRGYLTAFWACVLGGFVPAPVAVATTYASHNEVNRKLHNAWELLGRPVLVTDRATEPALRQVRTLWQEPDVRILTVGELIDNERDTNWFPATPDSAVLNLLTSGSTGVPKCVRHTNASVVARSFAVAAACGLTGDDVSLIWMPFDHVTVAMYNVRDVFLRCTHVNAKTNHFLGDCLLWLDWVDRYRVTNTWAPNFAFAMINEREAEIRERTWDLSCLREMTNAGEPVIAATSHKFLELLAPHGLPADAMTPCWGMSETCSGVTYTRQSRADRTAGTAAIDPATLSGNIRYLEPTDRDAVVLSTVGGPIPGVRLRVVDENGAILPEGRMGELRITGETMMAGYFNNDEANRESYAPDGWFRTGDLAFVRHGEVVIAGRIKDQIIVRGINYLAHEIESVVERVDGVRVTFVAAAGIREPGASTDQLVIFFVPQQWDATALATVAESIRATLGREVGLAPDLLVPVTEPEFPKTGSGKIQRAALVKELGAGTFDDRTIGTEQPAEDIPDTWLTRRQWTELPKRNDTDTGPTLVIGEDDELLRLDIAGDVLAAHRGTGFEAETKYRYQVRTTDRDSISQLLTTITAENGPLSTVVFALPLTRTDEGPAQRLTTITTEITALAAALADGEHGEPLVLILTEGAVHARQDDKIDLGTCALPGLVRTAISELAPLTIRQVDLPRNRNAWPTAIKTELTDRTHAGIVAARENRRWQPKLVPVTEEPPTTPPVKPGGAYLITGGLGGIAYDVASYLTATYGTKLLLTGRSTPTGDKAERLAELQALGDVTYTRTDVADHDALETAVARWHDGLDGVLHLAGADPTAQWADLDRHTLANETRETFDQQYQAKVAGTLAIAQLLEAHPAATLTLFGSVNGEFGGHSFGAYSAANAFLTGFADHWHHEKGRPIHCLAWSMWTGVGMNKTQPTAAAEHRGFRAIDPDDGLRLFLNATARPHHHLIIGLDLANPMITDELVADQLRVNEIVIAYTAHDVDRTAIRTAIATTTADSPVPIRLVEVPAIPRDADGNPDQAQLRQDVAPGKPKRAFHAPATDLERALATIWQAALSRPRIGRDDTFFDLGGNSLRATRLLALIEAELAVKITTQDLYENPTVAGMADVVARRTG